MMQFHVLGKIPVGDYHTWSHRMEPATLVDPPQCPACGEYSGMMLWLPPYHATIVASFSKLGDISPTGCNSYLVSERFRHAWEESHLQGIDEFFPIERLRVRPARLGKSGPVFYHILPPRGPRIDFARSHFKYGGMITCDYCQSMPKFNSVRGFSIEPASWKGEDMFRPWGFSGTVVVTDRVRQLRDEYDLKNVELTPVEEYVFPPDHGVDERKS